MNKTCVFCISENAVSFVNDTFKILSMFCKTKYVWLEHACKQHKCEYKNNIKIHITCSVLSRILNRVWNWRIYTLSNVARTYMYMLLGRQHIYFKSDVFGELTTLCGVCSVASGLFGLVFNVVIHTHFRLTLDNHNGISFTAIICVRDNDNNW